jgi:hypothetical protein
LNPAVKRILLLQYHKIVIKFKFLVLIYHKIEIFKKQCKFSFGVCSGEREGPEWAALAA